MNLAELLKGAGRRMLRRTLDPVGAPNFLVESNGFSAERYLQSLSEEDRTHVAEFVDFVRMLPSDVLPGVRVAVIAVGSTVRPESKRHHSPEDIDLRILNSSPSGSEERSRTVAVLQDAVRSYLQKINADFKEANNTLERRLVPCVSFNRQTGERREELVPFIDWYNNDPSFTINYPEGHPLHISISGVNNPDLKTYLEHERKHNGHFALIT